jgi:hypothetical protein
VNRGGSSSPRSTSSTLPQSAGLTFECVSLLPIVKAVRCVSGGSGYDY